MHDAELVSKAVGKWKGWEWSDVADELDDVGNTDFPQWIGWFGEHIIEEAMHCYNWQGLDSA